MALAKTTRPRLSGVFQRKRLFRELDRSRKRPVVWLQGPPGAGKTTLVASYVGARKLKCLWYQVDQGDADIANFFYHLRLAIPKKGSALPLLTPEYMANLTVFAQRFFRDLYNRLKPPFLIVLDNYQDVSVNSNFHEVIREALTQLPEKAQVIVISRIGPPPALARMRASRSLSSFPGTALRLTLDEARGLARSVTNARLSQAMLKSLVSTVDGWAAGLVLLLERMKSEQQAISSAHSRNPQEVFDYFAWEVFRGNTPETQKVLLCTALLPRVTAAMAEKLTGLSTAGRIIDGLSQEHYFTNKHEGADPAYQYHPLFREFLLSQGRREFASAQRTHVLNSAAALLLESNQFEDAVGLLMEAENWETLADLVQEKASLLLQQARYKTLEEWLRSFPQKVLEVRPWLLYWFGVCRVPFNFQEPREYLEKAFRIFRQQKEPVGTLLSWARIAEIYCHELQDLRPLDEWIAIVSELRREFPTYPSLEIEASVSSAMLTALFLRQPENPEIPLWAERISELSRNFSDQNLQMQLNILLALYNLWLGDFNQAVAPLESLRSIGKIKAPDWYVFLGWIAIARCDWVRGKNNDCIKSVCDALAMADEMGSDQANDQLCAEGAVAALSMGDQKTASDFINRMAKSAKERKSKNDLGYYYYLLGWKALLGGDLEQSVSLTRQTLHCGVDAGVPFMEAISRIMMIPPLYESGHDEEAGTHLEIALGISQRTKASFLEFMAKLLEAEMAFDAGHEEACANALARAFKLGSANGYYNTYTWRPEPMTELCLKALESDIEADYAKTLIKKRQLVPKTPPVEIEQWPWPIKVFTLGRFEVFRDDQRLESSRKAQRKPLELLKALIAFGSENVSEGQISEALWPDAEGDVGHQSLSTTLHRLRRLVGNETAIRRQEGRISLDFRLCWVDVCSLESVLRKVDSAIGKSRSEDKAWLEVESLLEKAVVLYRGPFLAGEEPLWRTTLDNSLRRRLLAGLRDLGQNYQRQRDWEKAFRVYEKALEIDNCAEEFYRRLMTAYRDLGRRAEAVAVYERCRLTLEAIMRIPPSAETEELYRSLRAT